MGGVRSLARWRTVAIGALTVPWLAGCTLFGFPPDFDGDFPEPSVIARFSGGSATIEIAGGDTIVLDTLARGATITDVMGSSVRWTGPDGWHLGLSGAGGTETFGMAAFLQFDRLTGNEHWTTWDPTRCIVDVEVADETGIRGTATCRGVEWYDALDQSGLGFAGEPEPLDEPAFDAEVTFEALP